MKKPIAIFISLTLLSAGALHVLAYQKTSITEVTLEDRTGWLGFLGKVVLRNDGTATATQPNWKSQNTVREFYQGKLYTRTIFDRLAASLEMQGFFNLKDKYLAEDYDLGTVIISVVRNGKRKEVMNYGDAGPLNLWTVEQVIRSVVNRIEWEKTADKQPAK